MKLVLGLTARILFTGLKCKKTCGPGLVVYVFLKSAVTRALTAYCMSKPTMLRRDEMALAHFLLEFGSSVKQQAFNSDFYSISPGVGIGMINST